MFIETKINKANEEVVLRWNTSDLHLAGIVTAAEIPGFHKNLILHAGPPTAFVHMCDPMKGAIITAAIFEGLASSKDEVTHLITTGQIELQPCHHYQCVGPMTGIVTQSMPLWKVMNSTYEITAYSTINEGMGDVLRFGGGSQEVLDRLRWLRDQLAPLLQTAIQCADEHQIIPSPMQIMAKALHMGDELHMRNTASSSLLANQLVPLLIKAAQINNISHAELNRAIQFITMNNEQFFLNIGMASAKAMADSAAGIPYATVIHRLCRNGTNIGMQVASMPDQWFIAPAAEVDGLFFSGFNSQDANRDIGDSAIMEVVGFGGMAMGGAPSITKFIGDWTSDQALNHTRSMYEITVGKSQKFVLPQLNGQGVPLGLDIIRMLQKSIKPVINTAIIHREAGRGMIGAGMAPIPEQLSEGALIAFAERYINE